MRNRIIATGLQSDAEKKLKELGFNIISFRQNPNVDERIAHHADLSFLFYKNLFFLAREVEYMKTELEGYGCCVHVLSDNLKKNYPGDVKLNCVVVGDYLICNVDTVSRDVLEYFCSINKKIINVNQGYTKCSVIPVTDTAVITDDASIGSSCRKNGMDVLEVRKGGILLNGFDYGFIGGTAGKLCDDLIVFNGDVLSHPDGDKIVAFTEKYGITPMSLAKGSLVDIGSIIGGF